MQNWKPKLQEGTGNAYMRYVADFETTTDPDDCRVWAVGICEVGNPESFFHYKDITRFMSFCSGYDNHSIYFHNLKFDGEFIISWLFGNGFTYTPDRKNMQDRTFTTLISDKGQFYSIEVVFKRFGRKLNKVTFLDSLKILPFSVDAIAKGWGLPIQKLKLDYHKKRPKGYKPTTEELEYLKNDVGIVATALHILFTEGLDAMTQGSNALKDYKRTMEYDFTRIYPIPDYDADIRQSYKGGFTYLNPIYKNKRVRHGIVLDVNSLYPSVMRYEYMPYGEGQHFEGKAPEPDNVWRLFVQMFRCHFELKPGHIPTIQLKNNLSFMGTEYVTSSKGEDIILVLTCIDLKLFLEHYDVYNIEYMGGWRFKAALGLFDVYIDKWTKIKVEAKESGNKAMYTLAKLMLNALYGKFALNPKVCSRHPYLEEDGTVRYKNGTPEMRNPIYIPVGTFITSYSRNKTIRAAQSVYDRFIYADTDSLHLRGYELPESLQIHDSTLGMWKHEFNFRTARFIRQKTYIEHGSEPGSDKLIWKITCAGMPSTCYSHVKFSNFKPGQSYNGKLMPRHVPGGIVLVDSVFTIKH